MQEYRWMVRDASRAIAADRGKFWSDDQAITCAAAALDRAAAPAVSVEIWNGMRLVGTRSR